MVTYVAGMSTPTVTSPCGLGAHNRAAPRGQLPKANVLRSQGGSYKASSDLALDVRQHHLCYSLLVNGVTKPSPDSRGGDLGSTSPWKE